MGELSNARFNQLPVNAVLKPGYVGVVLNIEKDVTEQFDFAQLLLSTTSGSYEWLPDTAYVDGDARIWQGFWWLALQDVPENIVPGTDAEVYWQQIDKSPSGFVFWAPGVYSDDVVTVLKDVSIAQDNSDVRAYWLKSNTRPYVSSDFDTELTAGDWSLLFSSPAAPVSQFRGDFDASVNAFPSIGGSGTAGAIKAGDEWVISVAGTLDGGDWPVGTIIKALKDSPAQVVTKWRLI